MSSSRASAAVPVWFGDPRERMEGWKDRKDLRNVLALGKSFNVGVFWDSYWHHDDLGFARPRSLVGIVV